MFKDMKLGAKLIAASNEQAQESSRQTRLLPGMISRISNLIAAGGRKKR